MQRWTRQQNLSQYHGIHLDLNKVRYFNSGKYGEFVRTKVNKNPSKLWKENYAKFEEKDHDVEIPYFRRIHLEGHRRLALDEIENKEYKVDEALLRKLKDEDKKWNEMKLEARKKLIPVVKHFIKLIANPENGHEIENYKLSVQETEIDNLDELSSSFSGSLIENNWKQKIYKLKPTNESKLKTVEIKEVFSNFYRVKEEFSLVSFEFFVQPKYSFWKKMDLLKNQAFAEGNYETVILDPPWPLNGPNPVRGPALDYSSLRLKDIFSLQLKLFQEEGLVCLWVLNSVYFQAMKWLKDQDYKIRKELHWIKVSKKNKVAPSVGHYLQHSTEIVILAEKNRNQLKMNKGKNSHIIFGYRRLQSQKPWKVHELCEDYAKDQSYCELFGRAVNLRSRWTTIGKQVLPDENECWMFLRKPNDIEGASQAGSGSVLLE